MAHEFRTITTTATATTITGGGDIGEHTNPHNLSSQARPTEPPQILFPAQINQNGQAATTTTTKIMSTNDNSSENNNVTNNNNNNLYDHHHYDDDVIQVDENVIYRTVRREDLVNLHHLQLELFPVRYKDEFYESLLVRENTLTVLALQKQTQKVWEANGSKFALLSKNFDCDRGAANNKILIWPTHQIVLRCFLQTES